MKCTTTWVKRFQKWQEVGGVTENLPDISAKYFATILQKYFAELRTEKGGEYVPDSLRTILGATHRYVKEQQVTRTAF